MNIEAMKKAAEAATPGPHHIYTNPRDDANWTANQDYLAAADPQTILKMIAVIEAAADVLECHQCMTITGEVFDVLEATLEALKS